MKRFLALLLAMITLLSLCLSACDDEVSVSEAESSRVASSSEPSDASEGSSSDTSSDTSSGDGEEEEKLPPIEPQFCTVISTGGNALLVTPHCKHTIHTDEDLLLKGLRVLYYKNA